MTAYMWFLLAERRDRDLSKASRSARSRLAAHMSPDRVAEAQRRASAWCRHHEERQHIPPAGAQLVESREALTAG